MDYLQPGKQIDKYTIVRAIGSGGAGTVYEARHTALDRPVAIKFLHGHALKDDQIKNRFLREAKVMTKLRHPNSVEVYDYGESDGIPFIVMELLKGHTLESELAKGTIGLERSIAIVIQVCDVLTEAHRIGLVHRDIKPENIFIQDTPDGPHVTLVDFGLAFIAEDQKLSRVTRDGEVAGTPQFLSPEQAIASPNITSSTDIYSLGCVFYELLTGKSAFEGATILALLNAHLYMQPESLRLRNPDAMIPAAVDDLVLAMLRKTPSKRPSAEEVAETLRHVERSDDMRGRGKPSAFFESREDRALTSNFIRRRTAGGHLEQAVAKDAYVPAEEDRNTLKRLGIIGEIDSELLAAAHTAGWLPVPFSFGEAYDVVVIIDNKSNIEQEIIEQYPTIVSTLSNSMQEITELLQAGVEDVLSNPSPEEIVRKAQRLYRTIARKKRGKQGH